jgi:hypothetical protein
MTRPNNTGTPMVSVPAPAALPAILRMADILRVLDDRMMRANINDDGAKIIQIHRQTMAALNDIAYAATALADAMSDEMRAEVDSYVEREIGEPLDEPT